MTEAAENGTKGKSRRRARREWRARELRRRTLSPGRLLLKLMGLPVLAMAIWFSAYLRTSDYPPEDAMRHLVALAGCDAAFAVGLAPAWEGGLGYHARNDPDGDGVACPAGAAIAEAQPPGRGKVHSAGGAKFVRP